jgi:integrase
MTDKELTLEMAFDHYIEEHAKPKGIDLPRLLITRRHIEGFFGAKKYAGGFKRAGYEEYHRHRRNQGVTDATVRRELTFMSAVLNHEHKYERLPNATKIPMPPAGPPRRRFLTIEEKERVLRQPMPTRIRLFFRLAFATAARAKAIEELTWDRVDFVNGMIDYNVPGARVTNKRRAVLPMSTQLQRVLEGSRERLGRDPSDPFVIGRGASTYQACKKVMRAAGIDERGVARHVCRKTFASHAIQRGVSLAKVAGVLADKQTTVEKSYAFILPEHLRDAVE